MPTLDFKGKPFVYSHHLSVPYRELIIDNKKSLPPKGEKPDLDDNLIIHGDNLEALKALLPRYAGQVDVIYIDPPYNTGKDEWRYNDRVNSPQIQAWLGTVVNKEDLERHDKWLSMMWPRISLLRELLAPTGTLFMSIDENEVHRSRSILDEIFGDNNHLGTIVWKNATDNNPTQIAIEHEYIVCYARDKQSQPEEWKASDSAVREALIEVGAEFIAKYNDDEERQAAYTDWFRAHRAELWPLDRYKYIDDGGIFTGSQSVHNPGREGYRYDILHPVTKRPTKQPLLGYRFPEETARQMERDERFLYGEDENKIVEIKLYAKEYKSKLASVFELDGRLGAYELRDIFAPKKADFKNPKPSELIKHLLAFTAQKDAIILDSFAGSGTTAHAVLALNGEDNGNRKFILVETEDYADSLTAERIRRVIKGAPKAKDEGLKRGFGGSFAYCELGEPMDLERFFAGKGKAPSYEQVARYVAYTATGETLEKASGPDGYSGRAAGFRLHLLYRDDPKWMRSNDAMLDLTTAERIAKAAKKDGGKPALVFAAGKLMGQRTLSEMGITFCQLPYSVHRILGDGTEGVAGVDAA